MKLEHWPTFVQNSHAFTKGERLEEVNTVNEVALIDQVTAALERRGLKVLAVKGPRGADQRRGRVAADRTRQATHRLPGASQAHRHASHPGRGRRATARPCCRYRAAEFAAADYLTPPVADALRTHHQQFADAAGNAYLEGPGVLVYVTGRKLPQTRAPTRTGRTFTANGLKILFAPICRPTLAEAPHRAIAAAAGVALGAVPAVLADLQAAGHVLVAGKNRRLNATKRLLDEWALAYARTLRPKTLHAVYRTPDFDNWR